MNASLISSVLVSLFLTLIIFGFIFGWIRGFSKSLTRFIMVICVAVIAYFTVPSITKALLNMDISSWNLTIGETTAVTLNEFMIDLLREIPIVEELIEASPSLVSFIEILPQMIVNVVLFLLLFFIFKYVSMLIYWIVSAVFFSKKKMQGKDKHNFIGAVIGAVQGLIVACLIFVPFYGVIETSKPVLTAMSTEYQPATQTEASAQNGLYQAEVESGDNQTQSQEQNCSTDQVFAEVEKVVNAYEDTWVIKMLSAVGVKNLAVGMYDGLTTVKDDNLEIGLRDEVKTISKAYPEIKFVLDNNFDIENNDVINALQGAIDKLYSSEVLSGVVNEVIPYASNQWSMGNEFCGIKKPTFEDAGINNLFNALLIQLAKPNQGDSIKNDLTVTLKIVNVCNKAGVLSAIMNDQDVMDVLMKDENENFISDLLGVALESATIKEILPDLINVAMDFVYVGLDIDPDSIDDIDVESSDINWEGTTEQPIGEKARLQSIFTNVLGIVKDMDSAPEGSDMLEALDFEKLGDTFDNIRFSQLFSYKKDAESDPVSLQLMKAFLNSSKISGSDNETLKNFIVKLEDVWTDDTVYLKDTFVSLQKALTVVKDMEKATEFNPENIGEILETLATDDTLKDVAKEIITNTDTLQSIGLDEKTAGVVSETVGAVIDTAFESEEALQTEIEAVKNLYTVANKVLSNDTTENPEAKAEMTQEDANTVIESLAQSNVLLDTVVKDDGNGNYVASENISDLGITENLDTQTIEDAINTLDSEEYADQIAKLNALFGTSATGSQNN